MGRQGSQSQDDCKRLKEKRDGREGVSERERERFIFPLSVPEGLQLVIH